MLELDLLLEAFFDKKFESLPAVDRLAFERLLEYPDNVLLDILMGRMTPSDSEIAYVVTEIRRTAVPTA
ncbi:FAD assembly factor SdhE [Acidihalobacter prosperus]